MSAHLSWIDFDIPLVDVGCTQGFSIQRITRALALSTLPLPRQPVITYGQARTSLILARRYACGARPDRSQRQWRGDLDCSTGIPETPVTPARGAHSRLSGNKYRRDRSTAATGKLTQLV